MKQFFTYTCTLNTPLKNFAGCRFSSRISG